MPLSRITQKQILARVTLNGTDGTSADAGDFIVLNTSADENDSLVLEEHTDFGTDILSSELINPRENIFRINENTLSVSTPHEMKGYDHYIIKHIVLDNRFNIISEKVFDPSKETPVSKHNIIGYEDKLYVLSVCNNHDTWVDIIKIKKP